MRKIKINGKEQKILEDIVREIPGASVGHLFILGDDETLDLIRDRIGDRLQKTGFNSDYKLNAQGEIMSNLIDKLLVV